MKKKAPKDIEKENKPKPSLIPMDCLIALLCPAYLVGTLKYWRGSWRSGFYVSDMFDATQRHLTAFFYENEDIDKDNLERFGIQVYHLGAAIFCIICMFWSIKLDAKRFDDRQDKPAYYERLKKEGKNVKQD